MHWFRGMKKLLLGLLVALPTYALADAPPKGPDFDAHAPNRGVDSSLAASNGDKAILPTDDVVFANDSAALLPEASDAILNTATWLKKHPDQKIVLEGHTSSLGKGAYNEDLATARASVVRDALIRAGVAADRIVMVIYGEVGAQKDVNPNDRRVILFASTQPTQTIVTASLQHERALSAAFTRKGMLIVERPAAKRPAISRR